MVYLNWEVDGASGTSGFVGTEQQAREYFAQYFALYGYRLVSITRG